MDNKKGIRLKTKQISLVDNIVNFFKKDSKNDEDRTPSPQNDQRDASPRSTTPRKKIFNKTPQKAGKININKKVVLNNKSMIAEHQLTFNEQVKSFSNLQPKSNLSPPNKVNYVSKPLEDTHFNKLILGASNMSINQKKSRTPERSFLSDKESSNELSFRKLKQQLDHYKKLSEQLRRQNIQLKQSNKKMFEQLQNLRKKLKSYELTNRNNNTVEITNLDMPKSPFEKGSLNQNKSQAFMKQSIPIMPETPSEYVSKSVAPKIQQMSFMSSNLKNISNQNSFISENSDAPLNFIKKSNNYQQANGNNQLLSPFMQKTTYDRTMKPQQNKNRPSKQSQLKQQITFSKTVGYLKGDQPQQQIYHKNKNTNPFQQIATQSNKFFFQSNNQSQSNNSFKVEPGNKGYPTRQWLSFNQSENSQQVPNQSNLYENSNALKRQNPFTRIGNPLQKNSQMQKNREQFQKSQNLLKSNSQVKSRQVDQSRTYKFEDFDADEGSSYVDFF